MARAGPREEGVRCVDATVAMGTVEAVARLSCKFQFSSLTNSGSENLRVSPYVVTPTQTRRSNRGENARTDRVTCFPARPFSSVSLPVCLSVCALRVAPLCVAMKLESSE